MNKQTARPGVSDMYIGRPSIFGNPFEVGRHGTRAVVLELYRGYFINRIQHDAAFKAAVLGLRGKRLVCWCKPLACHGDIIIEWLGKLEGRNA